MYCPRCSKEFESGTSYCRTCGLSLDGVVGIVKGEAETEPEIRTGPNGSLVRAGIGSFILGAVIGLSVPLFKNLEFFAAAAIARYVFLVFIMVALLLLGAGNVFPQKRYVKKKKAVLQETDEKPAVPTGRLEQLPPSERSVDDFLMPANSREPDSVTEHTTRQLR